MKRCFIPRPGFFNRLSVAILPLLLIAGCSLDPIDETKNWCSERIYSAAQEELDGKNYQKAVSYYEKLESRYPYGRYAQMAQLETAYAYWKDGDPTQALAALDRFLKLHP